jgi:predicted aldo/keto reductase-like oxidoreductase
MGDRELDVTRRQALEQVGRAGAVVLASQIGIGGSARAAAPAAVQVPRRVLGKTGEKIPILAMGGSMPLDPRFDPKLAEGFRYGVNYFDTAAGYTGGNSERAIGAFHTRARLRDKMWITTKSGAHDPKGLEASLHASFERLQTDHVEMLFLHGLRKPEAINDDLKATVERLRKEKKIRFFGFSCHEGNVAELLQLAAKTPWIDTVMFRYNFQQYGNTELNRAIDAAHGAKVGLIAMKTQASAVSFADRTAKFEKTGKWNKFQAVMKAVWADERLTAAVSEMDNLDKVRENVGAAVDRTKLTRAETEALWRYAAATRSLTCDGCDHLCGGAVDGPVQIAATLRYLMYHDSYGKQDRARELFRALPEESRSFSHLDLRAASAACPHGLDLERLLRRAGEVLA